MSHETQLLVSTRLLLPSPTLMILTHLLHLLLPITTELQSLLKTNQKYSENTTITEKKPQHKIPPNKKYQIPNSPCCEYIQPAYSLSMLTMVKGIIESKLQSYMN